MTALASEFTERERELGAIIAAYNQVTDQLRTSHDQLRAEVARLGQELARKNAELRRRERLAALGEMAAGVAHEIRNPLGGIQLFASLLAKDLVDRPNEQRLAEKITQYVGTLEGIVVDILEFGRPSEPNPACVDLGALVTETIQLAVGRTKRSDVTIEVADAVNDIELITDSALLQRALLNLIVNGIEAIAERGDGDAGHIGIGIAGFDDETVTIQITDNGPGLSSESIDRIFNPFFTTKDSGTGLGLAIVHQIAETLGGTIRAGHGEQGGARFRLQLPTRLAGQRDEQAEADGERDSLRRGEMGGVQSVPMRRGPSAKEVA